MRLALSFLLLLPGITASAQATGVSRNADRQATAKADFKADRTLYDHNYSSIRVGRKKVVAVVTDSLYIDTLIMEDRGVLLFTRDATLVVENAFIGDDCKLSSAGADGRKAGDSGEPGRNISLVMVFKDLGNLVIDTHGGDGAKGATGTAGVSTVGMQEMGGPGGPGGDGGIGGNLKLFYSTEGFLPVFNGEGAHTIQLIYQGGKAGGGGEGGAGGRKLITDGTGRTSICGNCPSGPKGSRGPSGSPAADGALRLERISN